MILSAAGLIPGFWATFLLVDKWGRRPVQLLGFTTLTILYVIMGASLSLSQHGFMPPNELSRLRRIRVPQADRVSWRQEGVRLPVLPHELLL